MTAPRRHRRRHRLSVVTKLLRSKTVWLAMGQAIVAVLALLSTDDHAMKVIGWTAIAKSGLDVFLRSITKEPIGKGQP